MDGRRIERRTFRMQSEHSTTELRAQLKLKKNGIEDRCCWELEVGVGAEV